MSKYIKSYDGIAISGTDTTEIKFNNYSINICRLAICLGALMIFIYNCFTRLSNDNNVITAAAVMVLSTYDIIICRKNWYLFTIFGWMACCNYSICMYMYFNPLSFDSTLFNSLYNDNAASIGINILFLFIIAITAMLPKMEQKIDSKNLFVQKENNNILIVLGISIILLFILIFGFTRLEIGEGRGSHTSIYEYSSILFIIGYYYTGNKKFMNILLTLILFLFVLQDLIFGGRSTSISLLLLYFLIFFSYKISIIQATPYILLGIFIFTLVGSIRGNWNNTNFSALELIYNSLLKNKFVLSTAYSAYHTSLTFIKVTDLISVTDRIELFGKFILSLFLGGTKVKGASLPVYTRGFYMHYYGGLLPFYFNFYLGWIGVIVSALIVKFYINIINKLNIDSNYLIKAVCIYVCITVPRWYLYSPFPLLRGTVLLVLLCIVTNFFHKICKKHISKSDLQMNSTIKQGGRHDKTRYIK